MKRALLVVTVTLVASCEIVGDDVDARPGCFDCDRNFSVDRSTDLALNPPLPGGQQGCLAGQKVAWVHLQETPQRLGKLACVPDGTVPDGGSCTFGPVGETTGYDDCLAGFVCSEGVCADICSLSVVAPPAAMCATGTCIADPLLFANSVDLPILGVCR